MDDYHFELIKELSKIFPSSNFLNNINTVLVEDEISSLDLIDRNDFVLLYNLSIYLKENLNKAKFLEGPFTKMIFEILSREKKA